MILSSFRARLVFLTGLLAAIVLCGFAGVAWTIAREAALRAFDAEIANRLVPRAVDESSRNPAASVEAELHLDIDRDGPNRVALLIRGEAGALLYRSPDWPEDPDHLPRPIHVDRPPPDHPPPPEGPPPPRPDGWHLPLPGFGRPPPPPPRPTRDPPPTVRLEWLVDTHGERWRAGFGAVPDREIAVAVSERVVDAELSPITTGFLIGVPVALVLAGIGAWLISGQMVRPIRRLGASIDAMTAQGLETRLDLVDEPAEIQHLVQAYNAMLERLQRSFGQASRFSGDAAHELKTPLAILQGEIEQGLGEVVEGSAMQRRLSGLLDEVRRLSAICRKLLLLSLADAGRLPLSLEPFAIDEALDELAEDIQTLAPGLALTMQVPRGLIVQGDAQLLRQALQNLASNAIKYNLAEGWIRITATRVANGIVVTIANACAGIPEAARPRIFDRFYRADTAHGRRVDGVGLGLGLAREILRAHGGELELADGEPGEVRFVMRLPG